MNARVKAGKVRIADRLHLLLAGDIIESAGTRSYVRELLTHLQGIGFDVQAHVFQFRLHAQPTAAGSCAVADFPVPVHMAVGGKWFSHVPRALYRLGERFVLAMFVWRTMRSVQQHDALILSGCLGVMHLLPRKLPRRCWWLKLGLIEEEGTSGLRYRLRKLIEGLHARRFPRRMGVSQPMLDFLEQEYGRAQDGDFVLPCLVDLERFPACGDRAALRRRLGFKGRLVLAYVGTAAPWQCAEESVQLFELVRSMRPHAFFWALTPDVEHFRALLSHLPKDAWRVEFKPHAELALLLPAADVGCLLRRDDAINRVASPLKLPEYLACGLPVLIGPSVGAYSGLVREQRLGAVIDPQKPEQWHAGLQTLFDLLTKQKDVRQRCRRAAEGLSWQAYAPRIKEELRRA